MMLAAVTAEAETGAKTRVNELSTKFETTKRAMTAKTTFLKERRGLRGVKCILGRSPCELVTSAFAQGPARSAIPTCTSPAMHGVGGLRMVETNGLATLKWAQPV